MQGVKLKLRMYHNENHDQNSMVSNITRNKKRRDDKGGEEDKKQTLLEKTTKITVNVGLAVWYWW